MVLRRNRAKSDYGEAVHSRPNPGLHHPRKAIQKKTLAWFPDLIVEVNIEKGTHGASGDTINLASRLTAIVSD
jgi:hypothetical protein